LGGFDLLPINNVLTQDPPRIIQYFLKDWNNYKISRASLEVSYLNSTQPVRDKKLYLTEVRTSSEGQKMISNLGPQIQRGTKKLFKWSPHIQWGTNIFYLRLFYSSREECMLYISALGAMLIKQYRKIMKRKNNWV